MALKCLLQNPLKSVTFDLRLVGSTHPTFLALDSVGLSEVETQPTGVAHLIWWIRIVGAQGLRPV